MALPTLKSSKLTPKENICLTIENKGIIRETETLDCDDAVVERLAYNYIIVKNILSNLSWQEQLLCKLVCKTWCDAIRSLQREQLAASDFTLCGRGKSVWFFASRTITTEPLAVFSFITTTSMGLPHKCKLITPDVCDPPCDDEAHDVLDVVDHFVNSPKDCMVTVKSDNLAYMPAFDSPTALYTIRKQKKYYVKSHISGIVIPKIPNVGYHVFNIKHLDNTKSEFFKPVERLTKTECIKGMLIFVTDKYLLHSQDEVELINRFKDLQKVPYAIGGCVICDTVCNTGEISSIINCSNDDTEFISENVITVTIFTVPKHHEEGDKMKNNFEMYSLVLESSEWNKVNIKKTLQEFSDAIPCFEHSAALKLSCVGRDLRHDQQIFHDHFPRTPIVGCSGYGEIGVNFPPRTPDPERQYSARIDFLKRQKIIHPSIMYSYATVFVYFGWGKILPK